MIDKFIAVLFIEKILPNKTKVIGNAFEINTILPRTTGLIILIEHSYCLFSQLIGPLPINANPSVCGGARVTE